MSFEVHPGVGLAPLPVAAGGSSAALEFTELAAVDPVLGRDTMFVQVVQINEGGEGDGHVAADPLIRLAAGPGPLTDVGAASTPLPAQAGGQPAANATLTAGAGGLYLVEVEVLAPQAVPWRIQVRNNDSVDHRYVWVIGSNKAATNRPWLDVQAGTLTFQTQPASTAAAQQVTIANYGPGPLTLTDNDGADLGAGFRLLDITPRPIAGNQRGVARIDFTAPAAAGTPATAHDFASNDPGAAATLGHNNRLGLTATVAAAALWNSGDILAIKGLTLCRLDKASGSLVPVVQDVAGAIGVAVDARTGDAVVVGAGFAKRVDRFSGMPKPLPGFAEFTQPLGVAVAGDGTIVVFDTRIGQFVSVAPGGQLTSKAASPAFDEPRDIALDANGNVVACGGPDFQPTVMRGDPRSGETSVVASGGALVGPVGGPVAIAVEPDGTILTVRRFQGAGGGFTFSEGDLIRVRGNTPEFFAGASVLSDPAALGVGPDGTIVVAASAGVFTVHPVTKAVTKLTSESVHRLAVVPSLPV